MRPEPLFGMPLALVSRYSHHTFGKPPALGAPAGTPQVPVAVTSEGLIVPSKIEKSPVLVAVPPLLLPPVLARISRRSA